MSSGSIGKLLGTIPYANPSDYRFGNAVAISGNTAIIATAGTIVQSFPGSGGGFETDSVGTAYIYSKHGAIWQSVPVATLNAPSNTGYFGFAVAISGTTAVVSDPWVGAVYVYVKGHTGWPTTPTTTLADPTAGSPDDGFGNAVAISGGTIIVGNQGAGNGAAYIYSESSAGWPTTPTMTLPDVDVNGSGFGISVGISGTTAVVGSLSAAGHGSVYVYSEGISGWPITPTTTLNDPVGDLDHCFGTSLGISGTTVVIGVSSGCTDSVAYVFTRGNEGWPVTPSAILHDPGNSRKDDFAATVAISGNAVVVGADGLDSKGAGVAYVFTKGNAGYWPAIPTSAVTDPQATRGDDFGVSVGISGTTAIIGAEWANLNLKNGLQAGAAYLYQA